MYDVRCMYWPRGWIFFSPLFFFFYFFVVEEDLQSTYLHAYFKSHETPFPEPNIILFNYFAGLKWVFWGGKVSWSFWLWTDKSFYFSIVSEWNEEVGNMFAFFCILKQTRWGFYFISMIVILISKPFAFFSPVLFRSIRTKTWQHENPPSHSKTLRIPK